MKRVIKYAGLLLFIGVLVLALSACGQKAAVTGSKIYKDKAEKKVSPAAGPAETSPVQTSTDVVPEEELSKTSTELDAAVAEVDSVLKEIDQIDVGEDQVPNL